MSIPILKLAPCVVPRPWGGNRLQTLFGKPCPPGERIGESWELSDHPEGLSRVEGGPFEGRLFGDLVRTHPGEMIGVEAAPARFPLLIKYIDAAEDLSIQVHPGDAYVERKGLPDRGKTECWLILDCQPGAEVIYGLREGIDRAALERAVREKQVPEVVRRVPISPGTFLFVPPGTVHALLAGTLLCEIQQSSNITYRLWDWDRKPSRPLHIEESLEVISYGASGLEPYQLPLSPPSEPGIFRLADNLYFTVEAVQLGPRQRLEVPLLGKGTAVNGIWGECELENTPVKAGDTLFIPACVPSVIFATVESNATLLLSWSNEL